MVFPTKTVAPPIGQDGNDSELESVFATHDLALANQRGTTTVQTEAITKQELPPELQHIVQLLCDTFESIDLRIETTLAAAETDFVSAFPELTAYKDDLHQLVKLLITDIRATATPTASPLSPSQPLLLRFAYQGKDDLIEQLLTGSKARMVVVPVDDDISLHMNVKGDKK